MAEQPHAFGWACIGTNRYHYYQATGESLCSYQRQPGPLDWNANPPRAERCSSCALALSKRPAAPAALPALAVGALIRVTRGRLVRQTGEVVEAAAAGFEGLFWWVRLHKESGALGPRLLLAAGQLAQRKEGDRG